jgi:outer membrane murein-binding lipoprotein Lpp
MSKVDRSIPRSVTNSQTRQAETPSRGTNVSGAAPVQATAPVDVGAAITGQTDFAQLTAALAQLKPPQTHTGRSADPGALWGQQPSPDNIRARFAAASPQEKIAIRAAVQADRAKTEGQIQERSGKLEKRWKRMNGAKRQDILKTYVDKGGTSPAAKAKIEALSTKSAAIQAEIDSMCAKLKATYPAKTPAEDKERRALKKELIELRNHQREVLNEATEALGSEGKKLELLATNEKAIDTTGFITKDGESLLSMIGKWLGFTQVLNSFDLFLEQNKVNLDEQRRKIEFENLEKAVQAGDLAKKVQMKGDIAQRDMLKQLAERIDGVRKG